MNIYPTAEKGYFGIDNKTQKTIEFIDSIQKFRP